MAIKRKKPARSSTRPGLQALLGRMSFERFLRDYWPTTPMSVHANPKRLHGFIDIPEFASIESMLQIPCEGISVQNRWRKIIVNQETHNCSELYEWGYQIYMKEIRPKSKRFEHWLTRLEADLGLPKSLILPNLFFCKKGSNAVPPWHFDPQEGFTVQIRGIKRWFIAENQHIANAPFNYKLGDNMNQFQRDCFPNGVPRRLRNVQTIDVKPGTTIFFPRGAWHTTRPTGDSVHLDLMIPIPNWQVLVGDAIADSLARDAAWRAPIVTSRARTRGEITAEAAAMFRELANRVESLDPTTALTNFGFPVKRRGADSK